MDRVASWLELNGYTRASTVREPGDYALRGGILDLFAPGMGEPGQVFMLPCPFAHLVGELKGRSRLV